MLAEALDTLAKLAQDGQTAATRTHFPTIKNLPASQIAKVNTAGDLEFLTLNPPDRNHQLQYASEVGPFLDHAINNLDGSPSVWIAPGTVQILITDTANKWRSDSARLILERTPQFEALELWENTPESFDHRPFVKMLRRLFSENIDNFPSLLKTLQTVRFENGSAITTTATANRASIGKEIATLVRATEAELPDIIHVSVKVYNDPTLNAVSVIPCMLDVESESGRFKLVPLAGACQTAVDRTLAKLRDSLDLHESDTPVFYGTP